MKFQGLLITLVSLSVVNGAPNHHNKDATTSKSLLSEIQAELRTDELAPEDAEAKPLEPQQVAAIYPQPIPAFHYPFLVGPEVRYLPIPINDLNVQNRGISANGGFNLGPFGAGFGGGLTPSQLYLGGNLGFSGNIFSPYNYQTYGPFTGIRRPYRPIK